MSGDSNTQIALPDLHQLDPYDFEYLVADLWEEQGYTTTVTDGSNDRGIDVVATKERPVSEKHLIQVKRYAGDNRIGSPEVRKYATLYQQEPDADKVVIVTTSTFTDEATTVAQKLDVELKNGVEIRGLVTDQNSDLVGEYFPQKKETTQASNVESDITETEKTDTKPSTANKESTAQKSSSRQEYLKQQTPTETQSTDSNIKNKKGSSTDSETSVSKTSEPVADLETFSLAGMWLIRLACIGFIVFLSFGALIFGFSSIINLSLHPQLLPAIGFLILFLASWVISEKSYESEGLGFVIFNLAIMFIAIFLGIVLLQWLVL